MANLVRARTSFVASDRRFVHAGDLLDADDPIIRNRETLFEPVAATNAPTPAAEPVRLAIPEPAPAPASEQKAKRPAKRATPPS